MKPLKVILSEDAIRDIEDIGAFFFDHGVSKTTVDRFLDRIEGRCQRIGDAPHGGKPRDDLRLGLRTVAFERRTVIAYIVEHDRVRVLNVFYGGRDYDSILAGSAPSSKLE